MSVQGRKYDSDFKRNAIQLTEEPGRYPRFVAGSRNAKYRGSTNVYYWYC